MASGKAARKRAAISRAIERREWSESPDYEILAYLAQLRRSPRCETSHAPMCINVGTMAIIGREFCADCGSPVFGPDGDRDD